MLKKGGLTALLLFGMFFGAGNLTFPPQLGFESGGYFWPAIAGFVLSGVGIAILTLVGALLVYWTILCHSKDSSNSFFNWY